MNIFVKSFIVVLALNFLNGCVTGQAFSKMGRQGDTITLAVGSPDGMTKSNTVVQFISDIDSSTYDLPIRSLIRIRPDNTSYTSLFDGLFIANIEKFSSHSAWLSVLVIDLPNGMTVGNGKVHVTTAGTYGIGNGVNTETIDLEIIEGQGSAATFDYFNGVTTGTTLSGDLSLLEPLPQVVVRPPLRENWLYVFTQFAAVEIKINVPMQTLGGDSVSLNNVRVVQDNMTYSNLASQTQMYWSKNGDDIFVVFISPIGTMSYFEPRFSVVLNIGNEFVSVPGPLITSITHYDVNGTVILAEAPLVSDYSISIE